MELYLKATMGAQAKNTEFSLDFVGIGAEKSGTTWISECLAQHPEVLMPTQPDLYFFNAYDPHFLSVRNLRYERGLEWYRQQFDKSQLNKIKGEFTPTYLYCPEAAARIKKHFPKVKLVAVLRDPVTRAFSQYIHDKRIGVVRNVGFEEAIERYDNYLVKGFYYKHLKSWYSLFPPEQILVLIYDDIREKPRETMRSIYRFLNLDDTEYEPSRLNKRANVAGQAKYPLLNYLMIHTEYFLRKKGFDFLHRGLETTGIRKLALLVRELNREPLTPYPKMSERTRRYLGKVYQEDIGELEKLVGRELTAWKREE